MDLASALDNLVRQVPAKEISISAACARIEGHIASLSREDARSLRHALPALLKALLGSPESAGWIELINQDSFGAKADSQALLRLLAPKGSLFTALLSQVPDAGFFYEIPGSVFPEVTRRIIGKGQFDLLPAGVYEGRLVKSGPEEHVLRLNMVEYFLFYFLYVMKPVTGVVKQYPANFQSSPKPRKVISSLPSLTTSASSLAFHWRVDASADIYLSLLAEYLTFMAPEITPALLDSTQTPPENILSSLLLRSNSPLWSRSEVGLKYGTFFVGVLVEFWLNLYAYRLDPRDGIPLAEPPFQLPTIDFLQALQVCARHFSNVYALSLGNSGGSDIASYRLLAHESFALFRLGSYRYLRVAMTVWPIDGTLPLLLDVWLSLISPWFHLDSAVTSLPLDDSFPGFQAAWRPFIRGCFFSYQSLYGQFFHLCADAFGGFLASGECEDVGEAVQKLTVLTSCLVEVMNPLLSVSGTVKELEGSLNGELQAQLRVLEPETFKPEALFGSSIRGVLVELVLNMTSLVQNVLKAYGVEEGDANTSVLNAALESPSLPQNIKSLLKWTLQVRQDFSTVFGLSAQEYRESGLPKPVLRQRRSDLLRPLSMKAHLKYKLAARNASVKNSLIRSYESGLLVRVLAYISGWITRLLREQLFARIEEKWNVRLPERVWRMEVSLRFFAAYPNLVFCVLVWVAIKIFF